MNQDHAREGFSGCPRLDRPRTVVVTGGASGIGLSLAEAFAAQGDRVAILDRDGAAAMAAAGALGKGQEVARGYACDVTSEARLQEVLDEATADLGHIDVLVSNAGFQHVAPLASFPTEVFRRMLDVMLVAPFVALKHVLPGMTQRAWGRVIHVASINGLVGFAGKAGYGSAKHGLIGLTKVAALEAASHGVTVNALCPGYVDTPLVRGQLADLAATRGVPVERVLEEVIYPLVPQRRLLTPGDLAASAVFLASDAAAGITGQAVVMDGGYTAQ
jgi:3-hydroxybutyrate dehydrogenase